MPSGDSAKERLNAGQRQRHAARADYVSYYTSAVPIVAGLVYPLSPREPSARLFRRRGVGDFEQAV